MWRIEERWKWFVMVMGLFGVLFIDRKIGIYGHIKKIFGTYIIIIITL